MMFFNAADILGYSSALTAAAYGRSRVQAVAFLGSAFCFLPEKNINKIRRFDGEIHNQSHLDEWTP